MSVEHHETESKLPFIPGSVWVSADSEAHGLPSELKAASADSLSPDVRLKSRCELGCMCCCNLHVYVCRILCIRRCHSDSWCVCFQFLLFTGINTFCLSHSHVLLLKPGFFERLSLLFTCKGQKKVCSGQANTRRIYGAGSHVYICWYPKPDLGLCHPLLSLVWLVLLPESMLSVQTRVISSMGFVYCNTPLLSSRLILISSLHRSSNSHCVVSVKHLQKLLLILVPLWILSSLPGPYWDHRKRI